MIEQSPTRRFSARSLLPLGFCGIFLLMAGALWESYRMQQTIEAAPTAFAAFDRDDALIEHVRHGFNQSQNVTRAFLLNNGSAETFLAGLARNETEVLEGLDQIVHKEMLVRIPGARTSYQDHFQSLRQLAAWSEEKRKQQGGDFVGAHLPGLRGPGNRFLRELGDASQKARQQQMTASLTAGEASVSRIFILLSAVLVLMLGIGALNLAYARELGRQSLSKVEEIARAKTDMQQLSGRLLTIQEEERHRLSRDLHDGIGQLLTALRIEISHLGHENSASLTVQDRERLQRARALAEEAVRNTRDIALLLRPSHLDDLGLEAALQWQAEDFSRRTGIVCHFSAIGLHENLPEAWKACVYRIVQEALHNCEKHAAPTQVHVRVRQQADHLRLEVQDDGVGFELNSQGAPLRAVGLGLLGMRERAAMLGGALQITSARGHGTTVRVELPVSPLPLLNPALPPAEEVPRREVEA